jgi:Holliday junction resolvasome RuvABC endonuclease subunit
MVLCLDLSLSNTGVSLFKENGELELCFSIPTEAKIKGVSITHGERLKLIASKLLELRAKHEITVLVIENGFTRHNVSTQILYKLRGVVEYLFVDCELFTYAPTTIKKIITGKGTAKKEELLEVLERKFNIKFENTDQSDSFALGIVYFYKQGVIAWEEG